jgi:predicted metalloprotease with PDZ domain
MRIRPAEYRGVTHETQTPTAGLWFSEGLTMHYADLLLRRAGLPTGDSSRIGHLENLISRYLANAGNSHFSAESISKVAYNAGPGSLGDYTASVHLVGELIGNMLDMAIRQATNGEKTVDDVMRSMLERHGGRRGFSGRDVETVTEQVCGCDVTPMFDSHVRAGGKPIDFDRYLRTFGLRLVVSEEPVMRNNQPERDINLWGWEPPGETGLRLIISDPGTTWGKAGIHTGDRLISINGNAVKTWPELRSLLVRPKLGDTLTFLIERTGGPFQTTVTIGGFTRPRARLEALSGATERRVRLRDRWLRGQ